jgi:hypothetical protein
VLTPYGFFDHHVKAKPPITGKNLTNGGDHGTEDDSGLVGMEPL